MNVLMVRSTVKAENVADAEAGLERLFAALNQARPEGIRYASCRLPDGVSYVAQLQLDEGVENPLPAMPEFRDSRSTSRAGLPGRRPPTG